jgi:hypothetical protein
MLTWKKNYFAIHNFRMTQNSRVFRIYSTLGRKKGLSLAPPLLCTDLPIIDSTFVFSQACDCSVLSHRLCVDLHFSVI